MTDGTNASQPSEALLNANAGSGPDWAGIKRSYDGDELTLSQIYAVFGITKYQFDKKRDLEGWERRRDRRRSKPQPLEAPDLSDPRPPDPRPPLPVTDGGLRTWRKAMIVRLYEAMDRQLAEIEQQQTGSSRLSWAERERQTRQMNVMTRSMEQLSNFHEKETRRGEDSEKSSGAEGTKAGRDPETWRLEIARRITRIREKWLAEEAASGD